ncbi:MAG: hypothetical protein J6L73_00380 [Muribaculaceae bacterium]|nr:hypothetical protein [Muribaculaceae bacterium]
MRGKIDKFYKFYKFYEFYEFYESDKIDTIYAGGGEAIWIFEDEGWKNLAGREIIANFVA